MAQRSWMWSAGLMVAALLVCFGPGVRAEGIGEPGVLRSAQGPQASQPDEPGDSHLKALLLSPSGRFLAVHLTSGPRRGKGGYPFRLAVLDLGSGRAVRQDWPWREPDSVGSPAWVSDNELSFIVDPYDHPEGDGPRRSVLNATTGAITHEGGPVRAYVTGPAFSLGDDLRGAFQTYPSELALWKPGEQVSKVVPLPPGASVTSDAVPVVAPDRQQVLAVSFYKDLLVRYSIRVGKWEVREAHVVPGAAAGGNVQLGDWRDWTEADQKRYYEAPLGNLRRDCAFFSDTGGRTLLVVPWVIDFVSIRREAAFDPARATDGLRKVSIDPPVARPVAAWVDESAVGMDPAICTDATGEVRAVSFWASGRLGTCVLYPPGETRPLAANILTRRMSANPSITADGLVLAVGEFVDGSDRILIFDATDGKLRRTIDLAEAVRASAPAL